MSYAPGDSRCSFTECQLSRIHYLLEEECYPNGSICSNLNSILLKDYCDVSTSYTIQSGSSVVWKSARNLSGSITVQPDATLTIKCRVGLPELAKIEVMQGGKLIVDGGTITSNCGKPWTGIEVLGTPLASQFDETQQGVVELKNGAVIELAEIGVSLHRRHPVDLGGGILRADGAAFINNQTAISFWDYNNFLPIGPQPDFRNLSRVKDCSFTVNDDFPEAEFNAPYFLAHIGLFEVRGISISGCTFTDTRTTPINLPGNVLAGSGIYSVNAQYSVRGSTFEGMLFGVNANNISSLHTFSVRESTFRDNYVGASARGVDAFTVAENDFFVGGFSRAVSGVNNIQAHSGLFIDYSSEFQVQENNFSGQGSAAEKIGICAQNTNLTLIGNQALGDYNEIIGNAFDGLQFANLANGQNREIITGKGLTYLCNRNAETAGNATDFAVVEGSIAELQRSQDNRAAGNTFTPGLTLPDCATDFPYEHISNGGELIRYFYNQTAPASDKPICFPAATVQTIPDQANTCILDAPSEEIPDKDLGKLMKKVLGSKEDFAKAYKGYREKFDDGDSDAMQTKVTGITPFNRTGRLSELYSASPYLSAQVLEEVLGQPSLSSAQKVEVLKRNPESLRKAETWQQVLDYGGFSGVEMDTLLAARARTTPRDSLEQALGSKQAVLHLGANQLIRHYLADTSAWQLDSIRFWTTAKWSAPAAYRAVDTYLADGDTTAARAALQSMETYFGLDPAQEQEHELMKTLKEVDIARISQGKGWHELGEAELKALEDIAYYGSTGAGVRAQNILNAFYGAGYYHEPILPTGLQALSKPGSNRPETRKAPKVTAQVQAFPNPARQSVTFRYTLPEGTEQAELSIQDVNGQTIAVLPVVEGQATASWDSRPYPAGLYFYTLHLPNRRLATQKLVILR